LLTFPWPMELAQTETTLPSEIWAVAMHF
jgi:hypothetical protein